MGINKEENSFIQYDEKAEEKYTANVIDFINKNHAYLFVANNLRKSFDKTIKSYKKKSCFYKEIADVKFLILTANEVERETLFSCCTHFPKDVTTAANNIIKRIPYKGLVYSFFYINNIKVVHVEPEMTGSYSKGGTAETLRKALKIVKPTFVISLGVAFGYDINKQQLCDVLVGRQFFSYDKSVKIKNGEISIKKLHIVESDPDLLTKIKSTVMFEDKMCGMFGQTFQTHIGNMLTGEYVIDSSDFKNLISEPFKPFGVIGGEMEAFGMFSAIDEYNKKKFLAKTHGIMIKGICDWAVGKNINISDSDLELESQVQLLFGGITCDKEHKLSSEDYKNNFQTLAMCNACTVCRTFLISRNFFSDHRIYGHRKRFRRMINCFAKCFSKDEDVI